MPFSNEKSIVYRLLKWSERYTKTDMVYLASGGFWLIIGQFGAAFTAFVFSLIVARYLPQSVYGSYKYILSLVTIIGAFSLTGLNTTIVRTVAQGYEGGLAKGFRINLLWSWPMLIGFFGVAAYYAWNGAYEIAAAVAIAAIATPFINSATLYQAFWNGKKDFLRHTLYWTVANALTTGTTIVAILLTNNIAALVATYFITSALANIVLYFLALQKATSQMEPNNKEIFRDATHLSVMNFLNTVSSNIDKIIVFHLLGTVQLAVYSFALAIPEQIRAVLKAGARLALPKFAERHIDEIRLTLSGRMFRFGIIIGIVALAYIIVAPFAFPILFPKYIEAIPYSQFFALTLFATLGTAPLSALQAHTKHRALYTYSILTNIIQIVSSILFITLFGLWGAAIAVLINRTASLVLPWYLLRGV